MQVGDLFGLNSPPFQRSCLFVSMSLRLSQCSCLCAVFFYCLQTANVLLSIAWRSHSICWSPSHSYSHTHRHKHTFFSFNAASNVICRKHISRIKYYIIFSVRCARCHPYRFIFKYGFFLSIFLIFFFIIVRNWCSYVNSNNRLSQSILIQFQNSSSVHIIMQYRKGSNCGYCSFKCSCTCITYFRFSNWHHSMCSFELPINDSTIKQG